MRSAVLEQTPANYSAVPLFATPFAAVNTGADHDFNLRLATLCESQRSTSGPPRNPHDPLHFRGPHDLLDSANDTAAELKRLILRNASNVVAGLSSIDTAQFAR